MDNSSGIGVEGFQECLQAGGEVFEEWKHGCWYEEPGEEAGVCWCGCGEPGGDGEGGFFRVTVDDGVHLWLKVGAVCYSTEWVDCMACVAVLAFVGFEVPKGWMVFNTDQSIHPFPNTCLVNTSLGECWR